MASFCPSRAFSNVDLPALGRPMIETKPERKGIALLCAVRLPAQAFGYTARMNFSAFPPTLKSAATLIQLAPVLTVAQNQSPFESIQVNPDRSVAFRYRDAAANRVELVLEGQPRPLPMERD